jgi:hypothetical protein
MIKLPPNCSIRYDRNGVYVRMVYSTSIPVGEYDGTVVWKGNSKTNKNGKLIQGSNYFAVDFTMDYQKNLPDLLHKAYYKYKSKAMIWNREQDIKIKTKENEILKRSQFPGTWDIAHLRNSNQLPSPPQQLSIFI